MVKKIEKKPCSNKRLPFNKQQASYRQTFDVPAKGYDNQQAAEGYQLDSSQEFIRPTQVSTSTTDHRHSAFCRAPLNKSYSTGNFNKKCSLSSSFESELIDKSQFPPEATSRYQLNSILSAESQEVVNKSLESLSSELLVMKSIDEEGRDKSEVLRESQEEEELELKKGKVLMQQQSGDSSILATTSVKEANEEKQNKIVPTREIINSEENIDELKMDTVRMNIQAAKAVEVIDPGVLSSIETARSCGIAAKR